MKALSASLTTAAIAALLLIPALPASAVGNPIDPGDSMYAINCDEGYPTYQFFSVDSTTAFSATIGTGSATETEGEPCAGQPAYDPSTGKSYYIQWDDSISLASIDVVTGVSATIGDFTYDDGEFSRTVDIDALAIGADGSAYVLGEDTLWSVDLATGEVEPIGESLSGAYAFAADPVTGKFYAITWQNQVYDVDVSDGGADYLYDVTFPDDAEHHIYSLQFDGAGTFWVEADRQVEGPTEATLWSFTLATVDSPVYSGIFTDDEFYTEALLIIPGTVPVPVKPALADTGLATTLPLVAGAVMLALTGLVLLIGRRRSAAF